MSRLGRLVAVVAVAAAATLAGCAAPTPLCDTAAPLLARGQVATAAEVYARAAQAGEGSCADDGVTAAGQAFGRAYGEVAAGSAAETSGDAGAAIEHYEAALRIDGDNQAALAGLTRMKRSPVRVETPVTVAPAPGSQDAGGPGGPTITALIVLAVVAALGVAAALRMRSRLGAAEASTTLGGLRTALLDTRAELTDATDATHDRIDRRFLELARLLVTLRDHESPAPPRRTADDRPIVLRWAEADDAVDTLLITATAADEDELVLHEFHIGGDAVHADAVSTNGALRGLAASPEDDAAAEALRDALGVASIERRGRSTAALPAVDPRLLSAPERACRRALDAAALVVTRGPDEGGRVVASCHRRDAAALYLDAPELVELLGALVWGADTSAAREDLEVALHGVVEDRLVEHLLG